MKKKNYLSVTVMHNVQLALSIIKNKTKIRLKSQKSLSAVQILGFTLYLSSDILHILSEVMFGFVVLYFFCSSFSILITYIYKFQLIF